MSKMKATEFVPPEALLEGLPEPMPDLAHRLRVLVRRAEPDAVERVRPGWRVIGYDIPVGRRLRFFAWIWAQPEHVHLGFPRGVLLADPNRLLSGDGVTKQARWLTVRLASDIDRAAFEALVHAAAALSTVPRSILADQDVGALGPGG
jgi:hypothetical protein